MSPKRVLAGLAIVALTLSGCAGKPRRAAVAAPTPSVSASASKAAGSASPTPRATNTEKAEPHKEGDEDEHGHDKALGNKYSPEQPPTSDFRPPDAGNSASGSGRLQLELKIDPGCAEHGDFVKITARTKPDVEIRLVTAVPGSDGRYTESFGRSDSRGLYEWGVWIPGGLKPGNYDVLGAAADTKGEDGGRSGAWLLVVTAKGGCR